MGRLTRHCLPGCRNPSGGVFPGTTTLNTAAPFGKSTNFSKPMSDYSKVVVDE